MKEYRFKNGSIYVVGEVNINRLKKATIHFAKEIYKTKRLRVKRNGNGYTS